MYHQLHTLADPLIPLVHTDILCAPEAALLDLIVRASRGSKNLSTAQRNYYSHCISILKALVLLLVCLHLLRCVHSTHSIDEVLERLAIIKAR